MLKSFSTLLCACFFLFCGPLSAQDLHITYTVDKGTFKYEWVNGADTTRLEEPVVKKGRFVYLHLQNFNPYTHQVAVNTTGQDFLLPATEGSSSPAGFSMPDKEQLLGTGFLIPNMQLNSILRHKPSLDLMLGGKDKLGYAAGTYQKEVLPILLHIDAIEKETQTTFKTSEKVFETRDAFDIARADIEKIKEGRYTNLETIHEISNDHLKSLFGVEKVDAINNTQVLNLTHQKKLLTQTLQNLKGHAQQYDAQIANLTELQFRVAKAGPNDTLFYNTLGRTMRDAAVNKKILEVSLTELDSICQHFIEISAAEASEIRAGLTEILTQTYRYDYPAVANTDQLMIDVSLTPKSNNKSLAAILPPIRLPQITVNTFGSVKVNTSAGIAFGSLFQQSKIYDVKDDKIVAGKGDAFVPMACTYFHFYMQSRKEISWGGSLGIGLPLSLSGNDSQSLAFLIGPSIFLGKNERSVLSAGLMGTRSTQLAKGYAIGDPFPTPDAELPTDHPYKWGYYLGFSFNLFNKT